MTSTSKAIATALKTVVAMIARMSRLLPLAKCEENARHKMTLQKLHTPQRSASAQEQK
jgi:hypothetical protein